MKSTVQIDKQEFLAEMEKWRDSAENPDERVPSERLGQIFLDLHRNVLGHKNFRYYRREIKEEMMSYSIWRVFTTGLKRFDFSRGSNPFSYFTRAAFLNYISVAKKYYSDLNRKQEFVGKALERLMASPDPALRELAKAWRASEGTGEASWTD